MPTVELAHFNRKFAILTYASMISFLLACLIVAAVAVINGELLRPYGWCLPIFGIGSLVYLPKFVSSFRNCLQNKAMIYIINDNLIAFDKSLTTIPVRNILSIVPDISKNAVTIKMITGEKRVKLTLSLEAPEEVSEKFEEFQSSHLELK